MITDIDCSSARGLLNSTQRVMKDIDGEVKKTVDEIERDPDIKLKHIAWDLVQKGVLIEDFIMVQKRWDGLRGKTNILATFSREKKRDKYRNTETEGEKTKQKK